MIKIDSVFDFDLEATITCGQIFRYMKNSDNSYDVILNDRIINIYQKGTSLYVSSNSIENLEKVIRDYFDLDRDYHLLYKELMNDKKLVNAINYSKGLKMIHQYPFETLISYIISQNNRVSSITNSLNLLSEKYGEKVIFNNKNYFLFPNFETLKNLTKEDFRNCKVGFRDEYLYNTIKSIKYNKFNLLDIKKMTTSEALDYLISLKGIGPKVASCILIFAYQKFDVFPIDTWVKKFMKEDYNIEGEKNIREFAKKNYKENCGIAIQYMFNYKRNKK